MAIEKKVLGGAIVKYSKDSKKGMLPWHFSKGTKRALVGGAVGVTLVKEGLGAHNERQLGRITYGDGPARMTSSFTSGTIDAINRASNGNEAVRNQLWLNAMKTGPADLSKGQALFHAIDNYGVDGAFISALYNMGG